MGKLKNLGRARPYAHFLFPRSTRLKFFSPQSLLTLFAPPSIKLKKPLGGESNITVFLKTRDVTNRRKALRLAFKNLNYKL